MTNLAMTNAHAKNKGASLAWPLTSCLGVASAGFLLAVLIGIDDSGYWLLPVYAGIGTAALLLWRGIRWPDTLSRYLSFGAAALIACAVNRALYTTDILLSQVSFYPWPFESAYPEWATFKGEFMTFIGTIITVVAWVLCGGSKYSPLLFFKLPRAERLFAIVGCYLAALAALVVSLLSEALSSAVGQFLPNLLAIGLASIFFAGFSYRGSNFGRIVLMSLLSLPFLAVALGSGMKEALVIALLPIGFSLWTISRTRLRVILVLGAIVAAGIITAYVQLFRTEVWYGGRDLSRAEAVGIFLDKLDNDGVASTIGAGIKQFANRGNASLYRGWAVGWADERRYEPELMFGPIVYTFIPRMIWPDKPIIRQGWDYGQLIFGKNAGNLGQSSVSAGLFTGLYLGDGLLAVVVGSAMLGMLIAVLTRLAWRIGGALMLGMFSFAMVPVAVRLDEGWPVGISAGSIIDFCYLLVVLAIVRVVAKSVAGAAPAPHPGRSRVVRSSH